RPIDAGDHRPDLAEEIIDIAIAAGRLAHHCYFAGELVGAAQPVDLAHIGTSEKIQDLAVALLAGRRLRIAFDIDSLAASAAKDRASDPVHDGFLSRYHFSGFENRAPIQPRTAMASSSI